MFTITENTTISSYVTLGEIKGYQPCIQVEAVEGETIHWITFKIASPTHTHTQVVKLYKDGTMFVPQFLPNGTLVYKASIKSVNLQWE